jgi:DNA-binding helix-hairpin-helix protein with protein kinase domain
MLGNVLGRGGEGAVYDILGRPDAVAKIYLSPPNPERQTKLSAMTIMATPALLQLAAWPTNTVHGQSGSVIGFIMPKVTGRSPVFKLYGPKLRLQEFPKADWRFLIHAAANTARAFSTLHSAGIVIGDVNHGNLVVSPDATVKFIDCDSFQISKDGRIWFCEVGVDTHQPPEMQALSSYAKITRTPNHDNFGLAIFIFQLLCMGRHPFAGQYRGSGDPPSIPEAIAKFFYAYSRDNARTMMAPPPGSLPIEVLTSDLRDLFETAFTPGAARGGRPAPDRWVPALQKLGSSLRECSLNRAHHFLAEVPNCPWCQIEAASGTPLFPVVFVTRPGSATGIIALWQEVTRLTEPPPLPALPDPDSTKLQASAAAVATARRGRRLQISGYVALAGSSALAVVSTAPSMRLLLAAGIAGVTTAVFRVRKSDTISAEKRRFEDLKREWQALKTAWVIPAVKPGFTDIRRELDSYKARYDSLPQERARRLQELAQQIRQRQLQEYLDRFPIASARIPGIGPAKAAMLASHGIDTAGDIEQAKVLAVPGFGEVTAEKLLVWRRSYERAFRFDPRRGASASDTMAVERDIVTARSALESHISTGFSRLKAVVASAASRRAGLERRAAELLPLYARAAADARIIPGDRIIHKRLLCLAGATTLLAMTMMEFPDVLQGGSPVAKTAQMPPPVVQAAKITPPVSSPTVERAQQSAILPSPLLSPASAAAPMFAPPPDSGRVVTRRGTNVRDTPNGSTVLRTVPRGMVLRVFARRDRWVQVGEESPMGWIYSNLLADAS